MIQIGGVSPPRCWRQPLVPTYAMIVRPVGEALAVGGPAALDPDGLHDLALVPALEGDFVELAASAVGDLAIGYEKHALAVGAPPGHDVGRRMPGQSARLAALHRDDVDVGVVVVVRRERDPFAVRREVRRVLGGGMRGELNRMSAVSIGDPDIAAIDEGEVILRDRGLAEQPRLSVLRRMYRQASAHQNDRACLPEYAVKPHTCSFGP